MSMMQNELVRTGCMTLVNFIITETYFTCRQKGSAARASGHKSFPAILPATDSFLSPRLALTLSQFSVTPPWVPQFAAAREHLAKLRLSDNSEKKVLTAQKKDSSRVRWKRKKKKDETARVCVL